MPSGSWATLARTGLKGEPSEGASTGLYGLVWLFNLTKGR